LGATRPFMPGVATHSQGSASRRARRAISLVAAAALLALLLLAGRSLAPESAAAAKASQTCPAPPYGLSPGGAAAQNFTMLIRINTQGNVNTWTQFNTDPSHEGLAPYVRPQDIFVLNTRFTGSGQFPAMTPDIAAGLTSELRATFPCNRIIDLNGMSFDPTQAGYAFSGIDDPNVYALLTDFEQDDWNEGQLTDPTRPPWDDKFLTTFPRIKAWDLSMASTAAANPIGVGKRTGLAPQDLPDWNYGQVAQDLNKKNLRLGSRKLGPQSVQTQNTCATGGAAAFGARAKNLRLQYNFKFIVKKIQVKGKKKKVKKTIRLPLKKQAKPNMTNLAMELSFTDSPQASASQAILSTSAALAAACVPPALKQGIGAFFFFAAEDGMRLFLQQPQIAPLRLPIGATSSSPNTGGIGSPSP
jgi:hypothetical protein